jgi:hypothetical protein
MNLITVQSSPVYVHIQDGPKFSSVVPTISTKIPDVTYTNKLRGFSQQANYAD